MRVCIDSRLVDIEFCCNASAIEVEHGLVSSVNLYDAVFACEVVHKILNTVRIEELLCKSSNLYILYHNVVDRIEACFICLDRRCLGHQEHCRCECRSVYCCAVTVDNNCCGCLDRAAYCVCAFCCKVDCYVADFVSAIYNSLFLCVYKSCEVCACSCIDCDRLNLRYTCDGDGLELNVVVVSSDSADHVVCLSFNGCFHFKIELVVSGNSSLAFCYCKVSFSVGCCICNTFYSNDLVDVFFCYGSKLHNIISDVVCCAFYSCNFSFSNNFKELIVHGYRSLPVWSDMLSCFYRCCSVGVKEQAAACCVFDEYVVSCFVIYGYSLVAYNDSLSCKYERCFVTKLVKLSYRGNAWYSLERFLGNTALVLSLDGNCLYGCCCLDAERICVLCAFSSRGGNSVCCVIDSCAFGLASHCYLSRAEERGRACDDRSCNSCSLTRCYSQFLETSVAFCSANVKCYGCCFSCPCTVCVCSVVNCNFIGTIT